MLWLCLDPKRLSPRGAAAIRRALGAGGLAVASISLWEIAMLVALGRVVPAGTPEAWLTEIIDRTGVVIKPITPVIAVLATQFPSEFSRDPADRLIAATARAEGLPLVSADRRIRASAHVRSIW